MAVGFSRRIAGTCAAVAALVGMCGQAVAQVEGIVGQKSSDTPAIMDKLAQTGSVRVIVQLAAPISPAAYRQGPTGLASVEQLSRSAQRDLAASHIGGDTAKEQRWSVRNISHFPMMAMTVTEQELAALAGDPRVTKVWKDVLHRPGLTESVPLIGMTGAYSNNATGAGTMVAVLDTGVSSSHPFLTGKVTQEACFSTTNAGQGSVTMCPNGSNSQTGPGAGANCSAAVSGCDHGTHVAGIAAGKNTGAGNPTNGVAKEANIFAIQVFSNFSGNALSFTSDQIAALSHVLSKVGSITETIASVNMSLGGGSSSGTCDGNSLKPVIDQLRAVGVATVIASGNDGFTSAVSAPGCISTAVTVGSTTKADVISSFSNSSATVDLLAPGSAITSSVPSGGFSSFSGTSMATPTVAGAFAAIRSRLPSATVDQIETALKSTGVSVADTRSGGTQTKPRIQVDLALNQLLGTGGPQLSVTPGTAFSSSGAVGGPFTPSSASYTLQNIGSGTLDWSAASSNTAVATVSPASGSLGPGLNTSVTVSVAGSAGGLAAGSYSSTISFTNTNNGGGNATRSANLAVITPGACSDAFSGAPTLSGTSGSLSGSNAAATGEVGEPNHATASTPLNSVWCKFTAGSTGTATLNTLGSSFDTTLAAYTGSSVGALTLIASNDDASGTTSAISFTATSGTTYFVAIDGFSSATGNYTLNYTLPAGGGGGPANDNFANAFTISGASGSASGSSSGATRESGEPVHSAGTAGNRSVWWRWTAPSTGIVRLDLAGSSFDTVLAVYTGAAVGSLTQVNTNDNNAASPQSRLTFRAVSGTTYSFAVDGNTAGASGSIALGWSLGRPARFDFDGDGTSDILWYNASASALGMFRMQSGVPAWVSIGQGASGWTIAGVGDFDGDGTTDILWYHAATSSVGMFRIQNGVPVWVGIGQGASGWSIAGTGDYNGDGTTDILWYHAATSSIGMFRMSNGVPTWVGIGQGTSGWSIAGSGDFNGDGIADILWYHASTSSVGMFRMNSSGVPTWVGIGQGASGWSIAATGDFNGDGTSDILWYHTSSAVVGMFQMSNGVPAWVGIGQGASGWSIAGTGDYNGDGTTDILWYHAASSVVGQFRMTNGVPTWAGIGQGAAGWEIAGNSNIVGTPADESMRVSGP